MKKKHIKILIGIGALLALILTFTPAWAGLVTPATWSATGENGNLGWQVFTADFDGDGYPDIVANAPNYDGGAGSGQGGVFVWEGSASGYGDPGTIANADWSAVGDTGGASYESFGEKIAVGDFNGDTYDDLAVSCPYCVGTFSYEGVIYVYFGSDTVLGPNGTKANADWNFALGQADAYGASQLATTSRA